MKIDNKFSLGDIVYLITCKEQHRRIVTSIQINPDGLMYQLSIEQDNSWHYDFEITTYKDIIFSTSS